jgi:putative oxidoreductase
MICGSMATAIRKVHARNGPWITEQGYEYNVVIIAAMAVLAEHGPGRPSVDARLFPKFHGPAWALAAVGAGVAGSYLVDVLAEPAPEEPVVAAPAQTDEARFTKEAAEARSES